MPACFGKYRLFTLAILPLARYYNAPPAAAAAAEMQKQL